MSDWLQRIGQFINDLFAGAGVKAVFTFCCASVLAVCDMAHPSVKFLLLLMLIDFALGAAHAWRDVRFSWAGIKRGVGKFIVYGMALAITSLADKGLDTFEYGLTWACCCFLIVCESMSALRHLNEFGGPNFPPPWLYVRLEYLKKSYENPQRRKDDWSGRTPEQENKDNEGPL